MAPVDGTPGEVPTYVVTSVDTLGNDLWQINVQMPDGSFARILVPGIGLTFNAVRLSTFVVGQLWDTKRGATPLGQG